MPADFTWQDVARQVARSNPNFVLLRDDPGFKPQQRREWAQKLVEDLLPGQSVKLPNSDPKSDLETASKQFLTLFLEGYTTVVAVPKKGLSIARALMKRLGLQGEPISSKRAKQSDIEGKSVLLFDDTIHKGEEISKQLSRLLKFKPARVAVAILWSSKEGVRSSAESFVDRVSLKLFWPEVPEQMLWLIFQMTGSPVLYELPSGAIANRPVDEMRVTPNQTLSPTQVAEAILSAACKLPSVKDVVENAPLDGKAWDTFHGELEVTDEVEARFAKELGELAEGIEYAKVRMFISPAQPFQVSLCGCLCPVGFAPGVDPAKAEEMDHEWSCKLLDIVAKEFVAKLTEQGFSVKLARKPMG